MEHPRSIAHFVESWAQWLFGHVLAVLRSLLRGLDGLLLLVLHPLESFYLVLTFPVLVWRARALIGEAYNPGLIILTPADAPALRTALTGLGDVTTSVVHGPLLTPGVVSNHFAQVREKLRPLDQALESALRLHSLFLAVWAILAMTCTSDATASVLTQFVAALLRGLAASLLWSLAFRILAWLLARWTFARLREV